MTVTDEDIKSGKLIPLRQGTTSIYTFHKHKFRLEHSSITFTSHAIVKVEGHIMNETSSQQHMSNEECMIEGDHLIERF